VSDFREAMAVVEPYAVKNGWVFKTVDGDDTETPDMLITLENMLELELADELPDEIRPAYRVVMHHFGLLFAPAEQEE
jgi:hypothetical protein